MSLRKKCSIENSVTKIYLKNFTKNQEGVRILKIILSLKCESQKEMFYRKFSDKDLPEKFHKKSVIHFESQNIITRYII